MFRLRISAAYAPGVLELLDVLIAAHHVDGLDALVLGVLDKLQTTACAIHCSLEHRDTLSSAGCYCAGLAALDGIATKWSKFSRS